MAPSRAPRRGKQALSAQRNAVDTVIALNPDISSFLPAVDDYISRQVYILSLYTHSVPSLRHSRTLPSRHHSAAGSPSIRSAPSMMRRLPVSLPLSLQGDVSAAAAALLFHPHTVVLAAVHLRHHLLTLLTDLTVTLPALPTLPTTPHVTHVVAALPLLATVAPHTLLPAARLAAALPSPWELIFGTSNHEQPSTGEDHGHAVRDRGVADPGCEARELVLELGGPHVE